ncbi:TetR/AcrR family transcriptional regulator [Nocardioides sp. GY 10127]|uniref:TetR/AcrR family transcriptional regulator n=1 Tax=Nocardioides sp. GY 10127 TaxID=2569762 RepID=UPI0010A8082B|nr:TetR/AcrR family transcriptional regulator [Nocardioides sp. GY 10127]TIC80139.1 TetR/AcrR family transcriptional regulator [Nocardioides sp. GY 10127]
MALRADAAANRERLLVAAREVFAEDGLESTMTEVARRAGVGVGTLYRRFPTRADLVLAVAGQRVAALVDTAERALAEEDAWEGFLLMLRTLVDAFGEDRALRELIMQTKDDGLPASLADEARVSADRLRAGIAALVARAHADGGLTERFTPTDVPVLVTALLAAREFGGDVRDDLDRRLVGLLLDGLRPGLPAHAGHERFLAVPPLEPAELQQIMRARPGEGR